MAKNDKLTDKNYICIPAFFRTEYDLKGNDLLIASVIYGFCQDGNSEFTGSSAYLMEWTGANKKTVLTSLKELVEKGVLIKRDFELNGVHRCGYRIAKGGVKITPSRCKNYTEVVKKLHRGGEKITPNNINNNIDISLPTNVGITHAHEAEENQTQVNTKTNELDSTMIDAAAGTPYGKFLSWLKDKAPYCYKNLQLPTEAQFNTLVSKYGSEKVANTVLTIENRKDYRKKYVNLYLTVNNWLRRDEEKTNKQ